MTYTNKVSAKMVNVMGDDLTPILAAKVSFDADDIGKEEDIDWGYVELGFLSRPQPRLSDKQQSLIKYLARGIPTKEWKALVASLVASDDPLFIKEKLWQFRNTPTHAAPFGHCFATFVVEAPVFVARQLVKHEYLRTSEVSRRYVKGSPVYYQPDEWHSIAADVKQGSGSPVTDFDDIADIDAHYVVATAAADRAYHALLDIVGAEEARIVLPLCHMTRWWWSGSLDAFANMANLRLDSHAQPLTREVAQQISDQMLTAFPYSWGALVRK